MERYGLAGRPVIMTLGRMAANEQAKGFDQIIELIPRLRLRCPDLIYLCAGDGDDRPRLEAKVADLGLTETVVFTGQYPEGRKPTISAWPMSMSWPAAGRASASS